MLHFCSMHKDVEINVGIIFLVKYPYMKNISIQQVRSNWFTVGFWLIHPFSLICTGNARHLRDKLPLCKLNRLPSKDKIDVAPYVISGHATEPLVLNKIGPRRGDGLWVMDCFSFVESRLYSNIVATDPWPGYINRS